MSGSYATAFYKGATAYNTHHATIDGSRFEASAAQPFSKIVDYDSIPARDQTIRMDNDLSVKGCDGSNSQRASVRQTMLNDSNLP